MSLAVQQGGGRDAYLLDAMLASIPSLPRPILSRLVDRMIDRLDDIDGDADDEELAVEDAFAAFDCRDFDARWRHPGCPVSDYDCGDDGS